MARKPRKYGASGVYHITMRAVNREDIFRDEDDYNEFLTMLKLYKSLFHFEVYAYALMTNHIHLLIKEGDECISNTMKRITIKFVMWYNRKYKRTGNLFQGRFHSEPIDNETYLLAAFRYITQNPLHAHMEKEVGNYPWTSFTEYKTGNEKYVETAFLRNYFNGTNELLKFLVVDTKSDKFSRITPLMEHDIKMENYGCNPEKPRKLLPSDGIVAKFLESISGCKNQFEFSKLSTEKRRNLLRSSSKEGYSVRSVSRVTGFSRTSINLAVYTS